jgi:hypothetical protein
VKVDTIVSGAELLPEGRTMTEENEKERVPESAYFGRVGRADPAGTKTPSGIVGGMTSVGLLACLFGILALVFAAVGLFPLLTSVIAAIGVVSGLRVFLPRVTTHDKVLIAVGVTASLIALVILLVRLVQ